MKLSALDGRCVRITLKRGEVVEGACAWVSREFNEAEHGVDDEALEISGWLFCRREIARVQALQSPAMFRTPFGFIEEAAVQDGPDAVEDVLLDDDPRNALRLLACLREQLAPTRTPALPQREEIMQRLRTLAPYCAEPDVRREIARLLEVYDT